MDVGYGPAYAQDQTTERLNLLYKAEVSLFSSFNVTYGTVTDLLFYDAAAGRTDYCFQVTDLPTLTKFYLRIHAQNDAGGGPWSHVTSDTVLDVPTAPVATLVESKETAVNAYHFILLYFDPVESSGDGTRDLVPINYYEGELSNSSGFPSHYLISQQLSSPSSSQTSFTWRLPAITDDTTPAPSGIELLELNQTYYLRVRAVSDIGEGNWSEVVSKVFVRTPGAPTDLVVNVTGPLSFNVSWTAPGGVLSFGAGSGVYYGSVLYDYALYEASNANPTVTATVDQSVTSLYLTSLTKGTRYYLRVRARNDATFEANGVTFAEAGEWSSEYSEVAITVPSEPRNLTLISAGSFQVQALWEKPADLGPGSTFAEVYVLSGFQLELNPLGATSNVESIAQDVFQFTSAVLNPGVFRQARLRAVNRAGVSEWSNYSTAQALVLPSEPLGTNVSLAGVDTTTDSVVIEVTFSNPLNTGLDNSSHDLLSFQIRVEPSAACIGPGLQTLGPTMFAINVSGLTRGCFYTFSVRARNEVGFGNYSEEVTKYAIGFPTAPVNLTCVTGTALRLVGPSPTILCIC